MINSELRYSFKSISTGERLLTVFFLTFFLLFLLFGLSLHIGHISILFKISSALADSSLIMIPFMLLKGKWRYLYIPLPFIISLLLAANIIYYRNFDDMIQPASYFNAALSDPSVIRGATTSAKWYDILYLILPFLPLSYIITVKKRVKAFSIRLSWKLGILIIFVLSSAISYAGVFRRIGIYKQLSSLNEIAETVFSKETSTWIGNYEMHNFTGYLVKCAVSRLNIGLELTPMDLIRIKSHISAAYNNNVALHNDSLHASCKGKNLIMIIVESLPYKVIEMKGADKIIPTLTKIVNDSASITSRCRVLADYGRSSDAQFIYNTGLLPLRNEALADNYAMKDYPSLAKALPYSSLEVIGESKRLWFHSLTTKSYGFDSLIDNVAPSGLNQDGIILDVAKKEISKLKSPFYIFITTISMHDPYDSPMVTPASDTLPVATTDSRDREYLERLHHFDVNLGRFLSGLESNGILDESIIVILGDHEIRSSLISQSLHDEYVPFIIMNTPVSLQEPITTTQLDVFPTIVELLGCRYRYLDVDYSGLGKSIFSPDRIPGTCHEPTDEDYTVSEMIIKGNPYRIRQ